MACCAQRSQAEPKAKLVSVVRDALRHSSVAVAGKPGGTLGLKAERCREGKPRPLRKRSFLEKVF
ncbi:hypothetical protein B9P99_01935 [Candidatus Marsarchaeota G1 archaeon OSP_B]|uniref:Uncharacterized protein n=4 Tax=Candidatus Marsarchaeota group 1 TaxID=2203770 RepID=A0A2R6AHY8_9ARCH|nr:MAG: hypothetical protein B9Q01_04750 [Candidatus Marsarchaeota G1 archaeon OSP_D]PSN86006.1 MAG: hypothetical protein B9Q02_04065 [Candidatus Marsarchaeota G1 archaeon BE_D]PSN88227.1 MAG: hypothetical protein B9Q00_06290 [Candidatus Marsarchaeota G1 archaeon OSP_C]PSN94054.1 MAG: hypothetical protein B9P99_01935 [Candidatus Marsarchaeota G1 archaeon OSP_B]